MSDVAIKIENLSKQYRLGVVGTGTLSHDLKRWWTVNMRGKEDPYLKIGETNDRSTKASSEYVWALKDINLEIKKGDVVGIIGKNGAGKSTLLKILSKVTKPTTGTVQYKGRIASLLEVGTGFHMEMTGRENIYMNGSIMGMTRAEITRKLDEIIDFAGVERYIDTPVKRYSSGMTVRLGFAIAAHLEPEILVVDEVLAVGDAEFQKKAIGKMQDVSKGEGRTVLFVSHNMAAINALCLTGIVLKNGLIDFHGISDECINHYLSINYKNAESGEFVFKNLEGNPHVEKVILSKSEKDVPNTEYFHDEDIFLHINFSNKMKAKGLTIGIALLEKTKTKIFTSHFEISDNIKPKIKIICKIPRNIMNQGQYSFDIAVFQKNGYVFQYLNDVCPIEIIDRGSELYYQAGANIGSIRVKCSWFLNPAI